MDIEVVVALIAALGAFVTAIFSAIFSAQSQREVTQLSDRLERERSQESRALELEQVMARFKEPLAQAAYDLQSRLFNILEKDLVGAYFERGDERSRSYVVENTVFLIAQYFAWTEIIRKEIQFIDLGESKGNQELNHLRDRIYSIWQTSAHPRLFRVFAGDQRAIGERMIREGHQGLESIGYAEFIDRTSANHEDPLFDALRADVKSLTTTLPQARPRLIAVQHALIDLLGFLDPTFVRFPKNKRTKVDE